VDFDPVREPVDLMRVWAILPGLLLLFWSREALESIDNKIGTVVGIEPNWASKKDSQCAWVQVEVNVREGLVGSVEIVYGENFWIQKVDYWKLPFRCFECHDIRHVRA